MSARDGFRGRTRLLRGLGLAGAVGGLALLAAFLVRRPPSTPPIQAAAFRMLPWSRVAGPAARDGTWRLRLRPGPLDVRVLSRSCGCLAAGIERRGDHRELVLTLVSDLRPARVRVVLGFRDLRGAETTRMLVLAPVHPVASRACVPLPVHVVSVSDGRGQAFAHVPLSGESPPTIEGDPRIGLVAWPLARGGWRVLVHGFVPPGLHEPGRVVVDGVDIPLRAFRRVR